MATASSIAAKKKDSIKRLAEIAEEMGGPKAEKRLEKARKKSRKNEAILFEELVAVMEEAKGGMVPDTTPIDGLLGMHPEVDKLLKKNGIKTKHDVRMATDAELLSIPGVGPGTLKRLRERL